MEKESNSPRPGNGKAHEEDLREWMERKTLMFAVLREDFMEHTRCKNITFKSKTDELNALNAWLRHSVEIVLMEEFSLENVRRIIELSPRERDDEWVVIGRDIFGVYFTNRECEQILARRERLKGTGRTPLKWN